ncbi:MAG: hypothetical protein IKU46_11040 [Peptococcaceae bacterium]|nr:hypothetical protein [Peptococcaceae bacterium]
MSKNALALVDCNNRDILFQFLMDKFDRKASKNEMVSPYDDQLIGKMNFRYDGMEHAMFFTYARSSEYPGMRFRNHKIIYLSLGVNDISSDIFNQICSCFGGFIDYNDDMDNGWQKIERMKLENEAWLAAMQEKFPSAPEPLDVRPEMRQILRMEQPEEEAEESREPKENRRKENHKQERRRNHQNGTHQNAGEKTERAEKSEQKAEQKNESKAEKKAEPKGEAKQEQKGERAEKEEQQRRPRNHHRGHRPRGNKDGQKNGEQKPHQKNRQEKTAGTEGQA